MSENQMKNKPELIEVYQDLSSNWPQNDSTREMFRKDLREKFEERLDGAVERKWKLPPIVLKDPYGEYRELLVEARDLFLDGHFYSTVAMCGIVAERLVKDVLRHSLLVDENGKSHRLTEAAFDQLEHVEINSLTKFLKEAGLLSENAAKEALSLGELRNKYAHARGKKPDKDAETAIKKLHKVLEDTVSVFKEFEIQDGMLVQKS